MISDVLSSAIEDVQRYLDDPAWGAVYPAGAPLTERIRRCVAEMSAIQRELDQEK